MQRSTRHSWPCSTRNIRWCTAARQATFCSGQCVTSFQNSGSTGVISCHAAIVPFMAWNRPYPTKEQRPSCVVHMDSADSGFFAAGALEHGHLPAVDGDELLQARGSHCPFRHPNSYTGNQLPSSHRPLRSKTYTANDTVELYCPWCESLPLTATVLSHGNTTECISTSVITTSRWCGTK